MLNFIVGFIIGLIIGGGMVYFIMLTMRKSATQTKTVYQTEDEAKKKENLATIENYILDKDRFTNDQLQKMLGVSDTTIGRYLEDLEQSGKIAQHGTGPSAYYTKLH